MTKSGFRIAFKPHLAAHILSDTEVALIGEKGRFALRGRAYATLAPLLDGSRSLEQVVAAVSDRMAPELAYFALERLERSGHTTTVPPTGPDAWHAWWIGQGSDPKTRAMMKERARVAVRSIGLEGSLAERLSEQLRASVDLVDDVAKATLEVCLVDDYLRPELGDRIASAAAAGRPFLPVRPIGQVLWLGPYATPGHPVDWPALAHRLMANRPSDGAVLAKCGAFPVFPTLHTPETEAVGLSMAALAIARCAAGDIPDALDASIWTIDLTSLESRSHALPCAAVESPVDAGGMSMSARPVALRPSPKRSGNTGGHRVCRPEQTLQRLLPLVSPITGIAPEIVRLPAAGAAYLYGAVQAMASRNGSAGNGQSLGRPFSATGKGQNDVEARVSCLAEAVERYSGCFFGDEPVRATRMDELGTAAIHPNDLLLFSERQYAERDALNHLHGCGFNWIPKRFDAAQEIDWTAVWSLTEHRTKWVPSALCYFGYEPAANIATPSFGRANSNGCASGNTLEEAILQGLLELIERDACALWWYNRVRRPAIDAASFDDPFFDAMLRSYDTAGRALHLLDLSTDLGIPAVAAVSWRRDTRDRILFGFGCHLDLRVAIARAFCEIDQAFAWEAAAGAADVETGDPADPGLARWISRATVDSEPYVAPAADEMVDIGGFQDQATDDISDDIRHCVECLHRLGHETLVLDLTRPTIGFPTVRILVPGLRHFWTRLAPGRLYDVPVALGWLPHAHDERDLNPTPFFM